MAQSNLGAIVQSGNAMGKVLTSLTIINRADQILAEN